MVKHKNSTAFAMLFFFFLHGMYLLLSPPDVLTVGQVDGKFGYVMALVIPCSKFKSKIRRIIAIIFPVAGNEELVSVGRHEVKTRSVNGLDHSGGSAELDIIHIDQLSRCRADVIIRKNTGVGPVFFRTILVVRDHELMSGVKRYIIFPYLFNLHVFLPLSV